MTTEDEGTGEWWTVRYHGEPDGWTCGVWHRDGSAWGCPEGAVVTLRGPISAFKIEFGARVPMPTGPGLSALVDQLRGEGEPDGPKPKLAGHELLESLLELGDPASDVAAVFRIAEAEILRLDLLDLVDSHADTLLG